MSEVVPTFEFQATRRARRWLLCGVAAAFLAMGAGVGEELGAEASKRSCKTHKHQCLRRCHKHKSAFESCGVRCSHYGTKSCGGRAK